MRAFIAIGCFATLAGLGSTEAKACMVIPFSRIEQASQVVVEGRYFRDPSDEASGYIETHRLERGKKRDRYEIRWDLQLLEDPVEGQCATRIPRDGMYELFFLRSLDDGTFSMIGRASAEDPDQPEEAEE